VARSHGGDLLRVGIGAVGKQDDRLEGVERRPAAEAGDALQDRLALLGGGDSEGSTRARQSDALDADQRRPQPYL
jgi:hypothetical protein